MPTPVSFLHGDFAHASVGGATLNIFDWTVTFRTELADVTGHGDRWREKVPVHSDWVFRGRGYVTPASAAHALNAGFANNAADPPTLSVVGYSGTIVAGTPIFTGTGVMTEGELAAPDGEIATQSFTIEGSGTPTVGV